MENIDVIENNFYNWTANNLGKEIGRWYTPYIKQLGLLLKEFSIDTDNNYKDNFFEYNDFDEYKSLYKILTNEDDITIGKVLNGLSPRYDQKFNAINNNWKYSIATKEVEEGKRKNTESLAGIPALGAILRSYLKFLYYKENPNLDYPGKKQVETDDNTINYWVYSPGENAKFWDKVYNEGIIAINWKEIGKLSQYSDKEQIKQAIKATRNDDIDPKNQAMVVYSFYNIMKPGDIVYVRDGRKKIIGRGIVTSDYYFIEEGDKLNNRRDIEWTDKGLWEIDIMLSMNTLQNITSNTVLIENLEQLITGKDIEPKDIVVNDFKSWLKLQLKDDGQPLNIKTIDARISALKDIENYLNVNIFESNDIESIKDIKETIGKDDSYGKYVGVSQVALSSYIKYLESKPSLEENEIYTMNDFLNEVFISEEETNTLLSILKNKKNLILKGAPGVGKTFIADRLAYLMMQEKDDSRIKMIQFHQSYSYEDFIEGFRPKMDGEGFELKEGPFVKFANKAARDLDRDYFFIIDEINRGNMSKIFGELMMLIEADKRGKAINLLYSGEKFYVPENLHILGMMNTADRSLAMLDYALRRRFSFYEIKPAFDNDVFLNHINSHNNSIDINPILLEIKELNKFITEELGSGFQIGHSYFVWNNDVDNIKERFKEVIEFEIIPQLYEYWFDDESIALEWSNRLRNVVNGL